MNNLSIPRKTVGVLAGYQAYEGNTISYYLLSVFQGILAATEARGWHVMLACGMTTTQQWDTPCPAWPEVLPDTTFVPIGPWNTDGLIIIPPLRSETCSASVKQLLADGFPVVCAGTGETGPAVMSDNTAGIYQAVAHLYDHGHRQIAFVAGLQHVLGDSSIRLEAFTSAMQAHGMEPDSRLIAYGLHSADGGWSAMEQLLSEGRTFTAVVTSNYSSAVGAMEALRAAGRRIPEDVAVIAYDDTLDAIAQTPPVTTVHQQTFELGYRAVNLLAEYIEGERRDPIMIHVPEQLIIRRSCGCNPNSAPHPTTSIVQPFSAVPSVPHIAQAMTDAALPEMEYWSASDLNDAFQTLATAFLTSIQTADLSHFSGALAKLLGHFEAVGEDVHTLNSALSTLRYAIFQAGTLTSPFVEDMLDQARLMISERARQQDARYLTQHTALTDRLGVMTAQLLVTMDEVQILDILDANLPSLGIHHAWIALFEAEAEDAAWSELWMRADDAPVLACQRFLTRRFPPPGLYPAGEILNLALFPLMLRDTQVGFVALDAGRLELCATIVRHISAALLNSKLYREAYEGRKLAEEANYLKTRFLSMVSHELRTPLSVIVGLSELMLREQARGKPPAAEDLERIFFSSEHLGFLIRDVLDLASSDAGRLRLTLEPLDLVEVLQAVVATGEQLSRDKGLVWQAHFPDQRPRVMGDPTRLRQVTLNLINNAVKFTTRGAVTFSMMVDSEQVMVRVSDTGIGISPDEQAVIFDEFRQSAQTAARGFGGLGLGLAISRHLIELHDGSIGVHSSGVEGEGASFYYTLPLLVDRDTTESILQPPDHTILLLTEHPDTAEWVEKHLRQQGLVVDIKVASQVADWGTWGLESRPDTILFDQQFASTGGWDIIRRLKDSPETEDLPILFYALPVDGENGAVLELDYRVKPLSVAQLAHILAKPIVAGQAPQTILIVDDDPYILDLHVRLIKGQIPDCCVLVARDGFEALDMLQHTHPDLVLLDLMMPEVDGFEVLAAMRTREATRDIPVIVLTAQALNESDMARLNQGVVAVLEKGVFSAEETLQRVAAVLAQTGRAGSAVQRLVRKAVAYIHANYTEPITREHLAAELAVSATYLSNCFQKEMGLSPMTYLNRYRIKQARMLLDDSDRSVTEISLAVGFSDSGYFSRVFNREVGVSPSAYRRGQITTP